VKLHLGHDEIVSKWVAQRIPHVSEFENMKTIGVMSDDDVPIGAVVYHEFRGNDIQMSCAAESKRWLSKGVLAALFDYPFNYLKCIRVTAMTPSRNIGTRSFLEKVGFIQEGIMRKGFIDDDCVVYGMLRNECKWIERDNHGQKLA